MAELKLWCCIERDPDYFQVSVPPSQTIYNLKKRIHNEAGDLQCTARELTLTKVDASLASVKGAISSGQYQPDVKDKPLSVQRKISEIWSEQPPNKYLHVFVGLPSGYPVKSPRLADDPYAFSTGPGETTKGKLWRFWKSLWHDKENPFREEFVRRDPDPVEGIDVPATMKVMRLPTIFSLIEDVMIRGEYDEAIKDIESHVARREDRGVVIVGHSGIGKTILLYYILVKRLLEKKPTVLQNNSKDVFIFDDKGCHVVEASSYRSARQDTWALVDLGQKVAEPARFMYNPSFFLVMASSPKPTRWENVRKYRGSIAFWFMKPFTLAELIQARQLQQDDHKEADIENFFEEYGPSARDCYTFCDAETLNDYYALVRWEVHNMGWNLLKQILIWQLISLDMDKASDMVLLVEPDSNDRGVSRTSVVTKAVSQMLWDRDSSEQWRNHRQLFKALFLEPCAKSFFRNLFEPAFHALCVRDASFTIYSMTGDCRTGRICYTFTNDQLTESKSEPLTVHQYKRSPFNTKRPMDSLLANHYYQPTASNHPPYDSLIYDADSHRISAFQVAVGTERVLASKGARELGKLGQRLQIDDLKIRIIVVGFEDARVTYKIEKDLFDDLRLEVYVLQVTEDQLYRFS